MSGHVRPGVVNERPSGPSPWRPYLVNGGTSSSSLHPGSGGGTTISVCRRRDLPVRLYSSLHVYPLEHPVTSIVLSTNSLLLLKLNTTDYLCVCARWWAHRH